MAVGRSSVTVGDNSWDVCLWCVVCGGGCCGGGGCSGVCLLCFRLSAPVISRIIVSHGQIDYP